MMNRSNADSLGPWLAERLGVDLVQSAPVAGGCIHEAWCLQLADGGRLFAKTNEVGALPLLEAEADGLAALAALAEPAGLVVPEPRALGVMADRAVLVLPWLPLAPRGAAEGWGRLGAALARLHRLSLSESTAVPAAGFGWSIDNFIGAGPQANGWLEDWGRFFSERRLAPQLRLLADRGTVLPRAAELLERLPGWLAGHAPDPCLVHGDLWSGNAALLSDGRGALFDPSVHRADREVDLAMARLFGGVPAAFFEGYEAIWPLPPGQERRVEIYNLYHLLNHANLFGGGYRNQAQASILRLLEDPPG
jgi:fructosamine-3-kinase